MTQVPNLNITCGSSDCENGHHAFNGRPFKKRGQGREYLEQGVCKACGVEVVDWPRLHARDPQDLTHTFSTLQLEYIRWEFWSRPFEAHLLETARERGRDGLRVDARAALTRIVGPVATGHYDKMKVPTKPEKLTSVIQCAQHAVAACCRDCVEKWHGIPNEKPLSNIEINYLTHLVMEYLEQRLPQDVLESAV